MNLYEKISQVMRDVAYLTKDDSVETGGGKSYRAISEEKVTSTVRDSLIKNGLVIVPVSQQHSRVDEQVVDSYGKQKVNRITTVDVTYRLVNVEKPDEYIDIASSGTGVDTQDKGVGKAMTYAYKYMLLRTFAIPTGDDADKISSDLYNLGLYGKDLSPDAKEKMEKAQKNFDETFGSKEPDLLKQITELIKQKGTDVNGILVHYGVDSLGSLTRDQKIQTLAHLKAKRKES